MEIQQKWTPFKTPAVAYTAFQQKLVYFKTPTVTYMDIHHKSTHFKTLSKKDKDNNIQIVTIGFTSRPQTRTKKTQHRTFG